VVRSRVLDIDCFVGDLDSAVDAVIRRALSGEGGLACCANAHVLVTSQRNEELKLALQSSWTVFPDGSPVAWLQRRSGFVSAQRIAGPDLMPAVLDRGDRAGCGTFSSDRRDPLLTQSRRGSWRCSRVSRSSAPRLRATGDEDLAEVLDQIRASEPHLRLDRARRAEAGSLGAATPDSLRLVSTLAGRRSVRLHRRSEAPGS